MTNPDPLSTPAGPSPERLSAEVDRLRAWLRWVEATTDHESGYYALHGYVAPTDEGTECARRFPEHAHPTNVAAPSPREEAVEATALAEAIENALKPMTGHPLYPSEVAERLLSSPEFDAALSAARPPSPERLEEREDGRPLLARVTDRSWRQRPIANPLPPEYAPALFGIDAAVCRALAADFTPEEIENEVRTLLQSRAARPSSPTPQETRERELLFRMTEHADVLADDPECDFDCEGKAQFVMVAVERRVLREALERTDTGAATTKEGR